MIQGPRVPIEMRRTQRSATVVFPPLTRSCFRKPPLSSRTVGFPESGWRPWYCPGRPSHRQRGSSAGSRTPRPSWFTCWLGIVCDVPWLTGHCVPPWIHPMPPWPRAPLPPRGVTPWRKASPLPLRSYGAHAPDHSLSLSSALASTSESLQVVSSPCWEMALPDVILRIFPRMLGPLPRRSHEVHMPVSSFVSSAFPNRGMGRLPASTREHDFSRSVFQGCRHSVMFRPPSLLASQIVPTAAHTTAGQPRLLHPGKTCFVTSARTGYASRPNTGN